MFRWTGMFGLKIATARHGSLSVHRGGVSQLLTRIGKGMNGVTWLTRNATRALGRSFLKKI